MKFRRPRLTVRRSMIGIAVLALALATYVEFKDGLPPRSVLAAIPARIERLEPGMSFQQTSDILGLEKSWIRGGLDAQHFMGEGNGHSQYETYLLRPWRRVTITGSVAGGPPESVEIVQSDAMIHLAFRTDIRAGWRGWKTDPGTRLVRASFSRDRMVLAEMPEVSP